MKKVFLVTMAILSTFAFVVANNNVANKNEKEKIIQQETTRGGTYTSITINSSSITVPYTITVPAPPLGTIINIGGPCNENMTNWTVQNGLLSITYTEPHDILCLQDPDTYYIETPAIYEGNVIAYKIEIIAR